MIFLQYLCNICAIFELYLRNICAIFVQYLNNICTVNVQYSHVDCTMFPQNLKYISKYLYNTRIPGPYGPGNSSPCRGLPRFARKNVRFAHILYHHHDNRKMFVPPPLAVCEKCLSPGDKQFVCPPPPVCKKFCPLGTNNLFVPRGQTNSLVY